MFQGLFEWDSVNCFLKSSSAEDYPAAVQLAAEV
jgi:hypothetical protein